MKQNMGNADRVIRSLLAVGVAVLYFSGVIGGPVAIVLGIIAVIFLASSAAGHCPGYNLLGLSTHKEP